MKISYEQENNQATITFSDDKIVSTLDKYDYLSYKLNESGDIVEVEIRDIDTLDIDIIRITYMNEEQVLDYLEEYH